MLTIATFYKFTHLDNCPELQAWLQNYCAAQQIQGTILLAEEGINGSIAASAHTITTAIEYFRQDPRLADLSYQTATSTGKPPFSKLKIKIKAEIVTFRQPEVNPSQQVGTYVEPQAWNALIADPEVLVLDTRNKYEVEIGTFAGAIDPQTASFTEFSDYVRQHLDPAKHRKVAMFCTGGIRCEKASAWMLAEGFPEVYHLQGGILNYLKSMPEADSQWQGDCYVFDERVAVTHDLQPGSYRNCYDCGLPVVMERLDCPHCGSQRLVTTPTSTSEIS
jgi:UPF0176 protein